MLRTKTLSPGWTTSEIETEEDRHDWPRYGEIAVRNIDPRPPQCRHNKSAMNDLLHYVEFAPTSAMRATRPEPSYLPLRPGVRLPDGVVFIGPHAVANVRLDPVNTRLIGQHVSGTNLVRMAG